MFNFPTVEHCEITEGDLSSTVRGQKRPLHSTPNASASKRKKQSVAGNQYYILVFSKWIVNQNLFVSNLISYF